jgi:hypothetical protein
MALVEINEKSAAGRKELEHLKSQPYAKIIENTDPNSETRKAIADARAGKGIKCESLDDMLRKLNE